MARFAPHSSRILLVPPLLSTHNINTRPTTSKLSISASASDGACSQQAYQL